MCPEVKGGLGCIALAAWLLMDFWGVERVGFVLV